jgi:predicted GNAT family acetyltransferase
MMTADLGEVRFRRNRSVEVQEVTPGPLVREIVEMAFAEYPPERRETAVAEHDAYLRAKRRGGQLAAFMQGSLVGFASWRDSSDGSCVELVGAWTKASHRGRGVYSTLSAYRCDRARERGRQFAVIVADPTTSGPIVSQAGFADHGPLWIYSDVTL